LINITSIDQMETLRYLGYGENAPNESMQSLINECEKQLLTEIQPRYLYKVFDIKAFENGVSHLAGCEKVVLMCATISSGVDRLIRISQLSDMTKTVILDSLASVAIEQLCNLVDAEIKAEYNKFNQTWRYSAGYGDFPIEIQKEFLDVLNAPKRIGLMATESSMLTPTKSVTAVIGLSENEIIRKKRGCQTCNLRETCAFRKRGERCEF